MNDDEFVAGWNMLAQPTLAGGEERIGRDVIVVPDPRPPIHLPQGSLVTMGGRRLKVRQRSFAPVESVDLAQIFDELGYQPGAPFRCE